MAYDGIVVSSIINEINNACKGGRCVKLQQPEAEIITLTVKGFKGQTKIYISVNASLPIVYIADTLPTAPLQAPAFCMLLRKHLGNGRLIEVRQPGYDRVFDFVFEHMDEMGDLSERHLIVEIMGRQSNVILTDNDYLIIDCLKRVTPDLSLALETNDDRKARILFPGKEYTAPDSQGKINPLEDFNRDTFESIVLARSGPVVKAVFGTLSGFSKTFAEELIYRAGIDGRKNVAELDSSERERLFDTIQKIIEDIRAGSFAPCIAYVDGVPKDYHSLLLSMYNAEEFSGEAKDEDRPMSSLLVYFYSNKQRSINIRAKSQDMRKILQGAIERTSRKLDLQREQLRSTEDRDKYRIYGELLNTYGYNVSEGEESLKCINYYDNQEITIPLDKDLSVRENSVKYFNIYNKKKRTYEALTDFVKKTESDLDYLLSAKHGLEIAENEADIEEIRSELVSSNILKKQKKNKGDRKTEAGKPLHFISSDGYDIYVGKNNIQNEKLTFGIAVGKDIWFHAKSVPGSHVIVKLKDGEEGLEDLPDRVFEEAASLAAYYCSAKDAPKVEIDYTERKNLKKPPGANPGYVIYHTNYSMMAVPEANLAEHQD
ncbi:Predicted component of the ribosome quality control (RQC) complex, YloA/Tae2 family, contains fibronectin-binding (FbpA) and DUF814 domains [Lachnospiraceae bacterium]|nr:Predicted component of the ribosome quality control (RQC) complex, YloA/Tae2 family, contains fibronectin-binding (FbpA) and DUF814 domains [Lachnospiraceae bacterium]